MQPLPAGLGSVMELNKISAMFRFLLLCNFLDSVILGGSGSLATQL